MNLQPRAMTRDLDWGIPVPVEGAEVKCFMYGSMLPLAIYQTRKSFAIVNPNNSARGKSGGKTQKQRLVHFIGKDNIVVSFASSSQVC